MLAALDNPGEEMRREMKEQMAPEEELLDQLRDEVAKRKAELSDAKQESNGAAVQQQLEANAELWKGDSPLVPPEQSFVHADRADWDWQQGRWR